MPNEFDIDALSLSTISRRCGEETDRFLQRTAYDPQYCYELFRRAVVDKDQRAWTRLQAQYQRQVLSWINRHSAFQQTGEDADYFCNGVFTRIWTNLTQEKFGQFPTLSALLKYVQMCVHGEIIDYVRRQNKAPQIEDGLDISTINVQQMGPNTEEAVLDSLQKEQLLRQLYERLRNDKEQQVIYSIFVLGLKPREIQARHSDMFETVKEVSRTKENIIARLKRDETFGAYFLK
ncbi:MAG: sigma-70 family RNA polymerase sigma factor [Chloroflexota bacterium]